MELFKTIYDNIPNDIKYEINENDIPIEYNEIGSKSVENNIIRYIDQFIITDIYGNPAKIEDIGQLNSKNTSSKYILFGSLLKPLSKQYRIKPKPLNYSSIMNNVKETNVGNRRISMGTLQQVSEHEREKVFLLNIIDLFFY